MPKNTVPAAGEAMPIDPVITIARELGSAERQSDAYGALAMRTTSLRKSAFTRAQDEASDLVSSLRDMITHRKATTLSGAAIQMCEIISRVDLIWDQFPSEASSYKTNQDHRAFERLAFSVLDLLSDMAEERPESVAYEGIGNQHMNPWKEPEELLARRGLDEEAGR